MYSKKGVSYLTKIGMSIKTRRIFFNSIKQILRICHLNVWYLSTYWLLYLAILKINLNKCYQRKIWW